MPVNLATDPSISPDHHPIDLHRPVDHRLPQPELDRGLAGERDARLPGAPTRSLDRDHEVRRSSQIGTSGGLGTGLVQLVPRRLHLSRSSRRGALRPAATSSRCRPRSRDGDGGHSPSARRTRMFASSTASATMLESETNSSASFRARSTISRAFSLVRAMNASRSRTIQRAARSSSGSPARIRSSKPRNCSRSTIALPDSGTVFASWR